MDKANYNNTLVQIDLLPREQFQLIFEASLSGKVTCVCCGAQVKLYLGIQQKPHFYHLGLTDKKECESYVTQLSITPNSKMDYDSEYIEQNGFRIPKSRTITTTTTDIKTPAWKPIKFIRPSRPFEKKAEEKANRSLDSNQLQAVSTIEGPLLVLAGAGSGKTRVLTTRTTTMITDHGIDPSSIMLVTFTSKAAKEMKERLANAEQLSPQQLQAIVIGTFHSIFYKIIMFHEPQRWQSSKLLKWDWQKEQIIKEATKELSIDERDFAFDQALQQIGYWKNTLTPPDLVKPKDQWEERVLIMYKHYEKSKDINGYFDFDDMLVGCYQLFIKQPQLISRYQKRLHYFLIDEFQDINKLQYEVMKMLSAHTKNLCVVGDDDQSIYGFRGSDPSYILQFDQDFSDTKVVTLNENYRSTHSIISSANKLISWGKQRRFKEMHAQFDNGLLPTFFFPYDEEEEATMIVTDLKERIEQGASPSDFAILYRTHTTSRALFERLAGSNLPFVIEQESESFYKRRIVRSLLAYLRLSLDPNHSVAMSDLLIALFLKKSALNELKASSILEDCTLVEALKMITNVQPFQQRKLKKIVPLFKQLSKLKPMTALEMIEKEMGFDDFVKKRGNEGNVIEKGSDDVRDLKVVAKKFATIQEFLEHVDHMTAMTEEMKRLSKHYTNAIVLSTIHRSKGLEYKHVYILSAVDGSIPHDYALDANRNGDLAPLAEERRLMYVAMTRAQQTLHISVPETRRGKNAHPSRLIKPLY